MNAGAHAFLSHSFTQHTLLPLLLLLLALRREQNIRAWIPVGGPFGGAAATPWLSMLSGDFFKLLPILSNLLPASVAHKLPITVVGKSVYNFAFGLPSWGFMLPRDFTLGKDHVSHVLCTMTHRRAARACSAVQAPSRLTRHPSPTCSLPRTM